MQIIWKKQSLNKQQKHVIISITIQAFLCLPITFISHVHFCLFPLNSSDLVPRCILNLIGNHNNFENYYFIIKYLIDTLIKICKEKF